MVEGGRVAEPLGQRRRAHEGHGVPADVRDLRPARSARHRARDAAPAPRRPRAPRERAEQQLHAEAEPEDRHARLGLLAHDVVEAVARAAAASPRGTRRRRARRCASAARSSSWSAVRATVGADVLERLLGAAPVAHPVVEQRDHVSVPLVDGHAASSGSMATATRSARANALKQASIMWCALRAGLQLEVERQPRRRGDRAEELLGGLVLEAGDLARRHAQPSTAQYGRPERSIAHSARASSIGTTRVAVAADPGAVAERAVERLAEDDAGVLHRVVRARSRGRPSTAHVEAEPPVPREQLEHVVEEADAGARAPRRRRRGRARA